MKMKSIGLATLFGALLLSPCPLPAADVWVVRVEGWGKVLENGSLQFWEDDLHLHNSGVTTGSVRIADASNGVALPVSDPLPIAPGQTILFSLGDNLLPQPPPPLLVLHLDVEGDVIVASRLLSASPPPAATLPLPYPTYGGVPMPVVRVLVPAGQEQIFLNADLLGLDSRLNVSLYNAGQVASHALVELVSECDDQVSATFDITVAANSIEQFGSLGPQPLCDPSYSVYRPTYLRITMDQPGFSFATMLSNSRTLDVPLGVAIAGSQ